MWFDLCLLLLLFFFFVVVVVRCFCCEKKTNCFWLFALYKYMHNFREGGCVRFVQMSEHKQFYLSSVKFVLRKLQNFLIKHFQCGECSMQPNASFQSKQERIEQTKTKEKLWHITQIKKQQTFRIGIRSELLYCLYGCEAAFLRNSKKEKKPFLFDFHHASVNFQFQKNAVSKRDRIECGGKGHQKETEVKKTEPISTFNQ